MLIVGFIFAPVKMGLKVDSSVSLEIIPKMADSLGVIMEGII